MNPDFVHNLIGGGQLGLLLAIFFRMGALKQAQRDHEASDAEKFASHHTRLLDLERKPG